MNWLLTASPISTADPVTRVLAVAAYMPEAESYPILGYEVKFVIGRSELDGTRGMTLEAASCADGEAKDDGSPQ